MPEPHVRSSLWDLETLPAAGQNYIIDLVDLILSEAQLLSRRATSTCCRPPPGWRSGYRIDGVLQLAGILPQVARAERGRPAEGARQYDHLSDRHPPGRANPRVGERGREAGEHVPHLFRREGRHPDVRRVGPSTSGWRTWDCPTRSAGRWPGS